MSNALTQVAGYLAGMVDGEGSVQLSPATGQIVSRMVTVCNTERSIIDACLAACASLGIRTSLHCATRGRRRPLWTICITGRRDIERVAALPLASEAKRERLQRALTTYKQDQRRLADLPAETIRRRHDEGWPGVRIAAELGVPPNTLYGWMDRLGIPRRNRWGR